jgi:AraC-like DNA-binding protein
MTIAFSTEGLHQRDRIPFWVDVASKAFFDHGFNARASEFAGKLDLEPLGQLLFSRCDCGPCEVIRTRREVARDGIDGIILCIRLTGRSQFEQGERRVMVEPGMLMLQDSGRPMRIEFLDKAASIFVSIPRQMALSRIGSSLLDRNLSTQSPMAGVAAEFLSTLASRVHAIDPAVRGRLADQALDLISLAFAGGEDAAGPSAARSAALLRLKSAIDARLSDPGLKPADVAAAAGISVRYANDLLAEEGTSIERYIVSRRLERCRRTLEDPLHAHRMIGEIAYSWGFSDLSHFTRRFHSAFGMTPGDCRRARGSTKG